MAFRHNHGWMRDILDQLEPLIIGQTRVIEIETDSDHDHLIDDNKKLKFTATAKAIIPGGNNLPGLEVLHHHWKVQMVCEGQPNTYLDLIEFVDLEVLDDLFSIMDRNDLELMDYRPHYEGKDRFLVGLGPVASIRHDPNGVITLHIHWGTEQSVAATLMNFLGANEFGSTQWGDVLGILTNVDMGTFLGGPEKPVPPFETNSWSTDYRKALALARNCFWVYVSPAHKVLFEEQMIFTESIITSIPG